MKTFVAIITRVPDFDERHVACSDAHRDRARKLKDADTVLMRGAWADPVDGSLLIFRAENLSDARHLVENDPYFLSGLWSHVQLREWNVNPEFGAAVLPKTD